MVSTGPTLRKLLGALAACLNFRLGLCGEGDGLAIVTEDAAEIREQASLNVAEVRG